MKKMGTKLEDTLRLRERGISYRDIATQLGIPLGTVMSRLHRARERYGLSPDYTFHRSRGHVQVIRNPRLRQPVEKRYMNALGIAEMRRLRNMGWSYDKIARYLNDAGIKTKRSGTWHGITVKRVLDREGL